MTGMKLLDSLGCVPLAVDLADRIPEDLLEVGIIYRRRSTDRLECGQ